RNWRCQLKGARPISVGTSGYDSPSAHQGLMFRDLIAVKMAIPRIAPRMGFTNARRSKPRRRVWSFSWLLGIVSGRRDWVSLGGDYDRGLLNFCQGKQGIHGGSR